MSERQQRILGVVERNVARLRDLIEDLLTLSRIEADAHKMAIEPVRLGDVINSAAATIGPACGEQGLGVPHRRDERPYAGSRRRQSTRAGTVEPSQQRGQIHP